MLACIQASTSQELADEDLEGFRGMCQRQLHVNAKTFSIALQRCS